MIIYYIFILYTYINVNIYIYKQILYIYNILDVKKHIEWENDTEGTLHRMPQKNNEKRI